MLYKSDPPVAIIILTTAILKDLYQNGKESKLMEIAMAPDSIRKMKKYITEGLENSGHFRTKAAATRMLSDLNRLKHTAIDHIKDGERQAKRAAGLDQKAALEVKKPVGKAFSV